MASTFSDLGIELMATGENAGTWGDKTNTNLQIVEKAIAGYVEKAVTSGGTTTLSITDGTTTESDSVARHAVIKLTGTITGNSIVTVPDSIEKVYIVVNGTSGAYTVQFKTASGSGITFGASDKGTRLVFSDGTNIVDTATGNVGTYDLNGESLILDADADTTITADTDDQIDIAIAGADDFRFTANTFTALSGSSVVIPDGGLTLGSTAVTSTATELNLLDGVSGLVQADFTKLAAVDSTAAELNIVDGGTSATSTTVADADRVVLNDNGTMVQVAVTDLAAYFDDEITAMPNLVTTAATTVGALDSGSITSGFGAIDNGSSAITTTGTITYGSLSDGSITITAFVDEDNMSSNSATLVPTQQSVKAYVDTQITAEDLDITTDSGTIAIDLDSETLTIAGGTGLASSASSNTVTLAVDAAQTAITSILATDIKIGEDNETKIDFETADEIHFYAANAEQVYVADGIFGPQTDSDVDLGSTSVRWKDAFVDSLTTTGAITVGGDLTVNGTTTTVATTNMVVADNLIELNNGASSNSNDSGIVIERGSTGDNAIFAWDESADTFVLGTTTATGSSTGNLTITDGALQAGSLDISGNIDVDGTANLDVVDIDGAVDMASTLQVDGAITSSAGATITTADNSNTLTLISTDGDANAGPRLSFQRQSSSPTDDDVLGQIFFTGKDSGGNNTDYATIRSEIMQEADGSEDGQLEFLIIKAGTQRSAMILDRVETVFNQDSQDIDFRVESNAQANAFKIDAGNETFDFNIPGTITTGDNSVTLTLQSTDDDANVGPKLMLRRHSGSPADGDVIGRIEFHGQDDNDQQEDLVKLEAIFTDVSNGSEDVQFNIDTKINGTNRSRIEMPPSETVFNEDSQDIDFRVESNAEANAFKIDGGSETAAFGVPVTFNDAANVAQAALTSSSNAVAWDATDKPNAYHLTTENTTFSAPSNAVEGAFICVEINYNGSHTIAWNTVFEFAASTAPTATSTDGKTDILVFRYNGSVWQEVGRTLNLSES